MLLEHAQKNALAMDAQINICYALGTRTELCFGHGCSGDCMLLEHKWNYGWGVDAQVTIGSWNTNGIMVWAWMLRSLYALGTRTESQQP